MSGWTNRGKALALDVVFGNTNVPTNFHVALVTGAAVPGPDTNILSDLTEIAIGNGYDTAGGQTAARGGAVFNAAAEDDPTDVGSLTMDDIAWTASGGPLPASGGGARYAVLTDDTGGGAANRNVWAYWDLSEDRTVSDTQVLTLQALKLTLAES